MPPLPKLLSRVPGADGTQRSSKASRRGREDGRRRVAAGDGALPDRERQRVIRVCHMSEISFVAAGLRYHEGRHHLGAQTGRRGVSRPGEAPAWRRRLTGRLVSLLCDSSVGSWRDCGFNPLTPAVFVPGDPAMTITVEAVYENGTLKLS